MFIKLCTMYIHVMAITNTEKISVLCATVYRSSTK